MKNITLLLVMFIATSFNGYCCDVPQNLSAGVTRAGDTCLHWDDIGGALFYDLQIAEAPGPCSPGGNIILDWSIQNSRANNPYCFIPGGLPHGQLQFRLRAQCTDGASEYSPWYSFVVGLGSVGGNTDECTVPQNPKALVNRAGGVCLYWDPMGPALFYNLRIAEAGEDPCDGGGLILNWSIPNARVSFPYCFIPGGLPHGQLQFKVNAYCLSGVSEYTAWIPFTVPLKTGSIEMSESITNSRIINFSPNPSDGNDIAIEYDAFSSGAAVLNIYDITGIKILGYTKLMEAGINSFRIDLNVRSGMYILEIQEEDIVSRKKFMIMN